MNNYIKKPVNKDLPGFTKGEEIFNAITHIVGGGLGIVSLVISIVFATINNLSRKEIVALIIYGVSMIILYTMSSIYHFLAKNKAKKVFRIFDHCTIYLLIAGTYTPICVSVLGGTKWEVIILAIVWIGALIGIVLNAIDMYSLPSKIMSMLLYVIMGWSIVIALKPLLDNWAIEGFIWLLMGGVAYTIGIIFFLLGKKARYIHSIWHLFVLLGTILQYFSILLYIILR